MSGHGCSSIITSAAAASHRVPAHPRWPWTPRWSGWHRTTAGSRPTGSHNIHALRGNRELRDAKRAGCGLPNVYYSRGTGAVAISVPATLAMPTYCKAGSQATLRPASRLASSRPADGTRYVVASTVAVVTPPCRVPVPGRGLRLSRGV